MQYDPATLEAQMQMLVTLDDGTQVVASKMYLATVLEGKMAFESGLTDNEKSQAAQGIVFAVSDPRLVSKINAEWEAIAEKKQAAEVAAENTEDVAAVTTATESIDMNAEFTSESAVVTQSGASFRVVIYGTDTEELKTAAEQIKDELSGLKASGIEKVVCVPALSYYTADANKNILDSYDEDEIVDVNDFYKKYIAKMNEVNATNTDAAEDAKATAEEESEESVNHIRARLFAVGAGVGFILGNIIIWLLIVWDTKLWSETEIEKNGGVSVLCTIKKDEINGIYASELIKDSSEGKIVIVTGAKPRCKMPDSIANYIIDYEEIDPSDDKDVCLYMEKGMLKQNELLRILKQIKLVGKNILGCVLNEG